MKNVYVTKDLEFTYTVVLRPICVFMIKDIGTKMSWDKVTKFYL